MRYEYQSIIVDTMMGTTELDRHLNAKSAEGWEVQAIVNRSMRKGGGMMTKKQLDEFFCEVLVTFRRPVAAPPPMVGAPPVH